MLELARAVDPDVVVLGMDLPVTRWLETCRVLRTTSDCSILAVTRDNEDTEALVKLGGADDRLVRPFHCRDLLRRVSALLHRPAAGAATDRLVG